VTAHRHAVYGRVARWLIHDLRNSTQALTLVTALLADRPEPGDPGLVDTVREATGRVTRSLELLDRLLRILPPAAEPGPVSVGDTLEFVAALFRTRSSPSRLQVDAGAAGALPAVNGVEHELEQVLLTLLLDAFDSLGEGAGLIALDARQEGDGVLITVTADGLGDRTNDASWEAEPVLAVGRELAARHGGSLTRERAEGRNGFALRLPRVRARGAVAEG
jgi:signal transduction histidine kinase